MTNIGFHVWNPAGRLPTYVHDTFLRAWAEKDRLQAAHPDQRFVVMVPVLNLEGLAYGQGFSAGLRENQDYAIKIIDGVQARLEEKLSEVRELKQQLAALKPFLEDAEAHQSIVADCLLWIQGFNAAYAGRESYERPDTPSADKLRDLNAALQFILRERDKASGSYRDLDDTIPF